MNVRLLLAAVVALAACAAEQRTPDAVTAERSILAAPDPEYRLSAEDRARVLPLDDPALIEQLLAWHAEHARPELLEAITFWPGEPGDHVSIPRVHIDVDHPEIQDILRRIDEARANALGQRRANSFAR